MNQKNPCKRFLWKWALALFLVCTAVFSIQAVQAASGKTIKTVTMKIGSKKANGTTVSMKEGKTAKIKISTSPKLAEKTVTYKSSKPSVVSVNKNGKLKAKKEGTSTISVTVRAEGCKSKKVTCKVKVTKDTASGSATQDSGTKKALVAYFSATNTTKGVAEVIADVTGAELYEITPSDPYTAADLDYNNDSCRANQEQQSASARPSIEGSVEKFGDYEVIYLGFPIWWGEEPRIIDTFLESYDCSRKIIVPFCTSGGSGISTAVSHIKDIASGSPEVKEGRRFSGDVSKATIEEWIAGLSLGN